MIVRNLESWCAHGLVRTWRDRPIPIPLISAPIPIMDRYRYSLIIIMSYCSVSLCHVLGVIQRPHH